MRLSFVLFLANTFVKRSASTTTTIINSSTAFVVSHAGAVIPLNKNTVASIGTTRALHAVNPNSPQPINGSYSSINGSMTVDTKYPGTAVERMLSARQRVAQLAEGNELNGSWDEVRRRILWAGGLRDLPDAVPGQGFTGHSFNDFNHVDLTCMLDQVFENQNDGSVKGIAVGNRLGPGIQIASLPELGPGGSWSTCAMGCNQEPPRDVAHIQFRSRIAFKLVWVPNSRFDTFVLVDDDGQLLAKGTPSDGPAGLPSLRERQMNYRLVAGSKYAREADALASNMAAE